MTDTTHDHGTFIDVGDVIPVHTVTTDDGATLQLRPSARRATIIVCSHAEDDEGCHSYVRALGDAAGDLARWHATALIVDGGSGARADDSGAGGRQAFRRVAADAARSLRRQLGLAPDEVAVLVVDRHGEVWDAVRSTGHDELPGVGDLEASVRFIAIQCPECEVPDSPGTTGRS